MIFTDRTITVRKGESKINEPIIVYRGDYELEIRFTISNSKFKFKNGTNLIESEKASHGQLVILTPYGGNIFSDIVKCNEGTVSFLLTKEMLDQIEEIGLYSFQIRLFDYYRESRITIPPIEYGIEIREPITSEDHDNTVNNAIVGYSIAKVVDPKEENVGPTFNGNGQYNKTDWETGDRISEGKLNKMEDALYKINQNEKNDVAALDKRVTSNYNALNATKADKNEVFSMKNMGQDIKEAMTGGSVPVVGVNSILKDNIVDGQVTYEKTEFFNYISRNLIDIGNVSDIGYAMAGSEPVYNMSSYEYYRVTDIIPVKPGVEYYVGPVFSNGKQSHHHNVAVYDSQKNFKRLIGGGWLNPLILNDGEYFVRLTIDADIQNGAYMVNRNIPSGTTEVSTEIKFNNTVHDAISDVARMEIDKGIDFDCISGVSLHASKNLVDPQKIVRGYIFDSSTGQGMEDTTGWTTEYGMTDYIEVIPGKTYYYCKGGRPISLWRAYYDEYRNCLGVITMEHQWEAPGWMRIPENCKYVRFTIDADGYDICMLVEEAHYNGMFIPYKKTYTIDDASIQDGIARVKKEVNTVDVDAIEFLDYVQSANMYDDSTNYGDNTAVNITSGEIYKVDGYVASYYIPVEPGKQYCCNERHNIALYNADKIFVKGYPGDTWSIPFTIPDDVYYIRVTFKMANTEKMFSEGTSMPPYEPYRTRVVISDSAIKNDLAEEIGSVLTSDSLSSKLDGLTWNVLGDSITSTDYSRPNWWEIIQSKHNMKVNGYGISGTTLSHHNERHLWDYAWGKLDANEIGYDANDSSTWSTGNCMVERYVKMAEDADIITVMGGTNDGMVPMGTPNDTRTDTFYGACNTLFKGLIEKYPDKIVAIFTPIQAATAYNSNTTDINAYLASRTAESTLSLQARAEIIKRVAAKYGLPVLDLYNESGINGVGGRATLLYRPNDTLHPSVTGNEWMARVIENFLLNLL